MSTPHTTGTIRVVRAADRHHWRSAWLDSWQSFPATGNFDLTAGAHGMLLVHNDDLVDAGEGFDTHQHNDAEIVTWVLDGELTHRDSTGLTGTLRPGVVQSMTAGRGISHSEVNGSAYSSRSPLRVVQMWLAPERTGLDPRYAEADFTEELDSGELVTVASGRAEHASSKAVPIANPYAALHVARMRPQSSVIVPAAPYGHLYVARGSAALPDGTSLAQGDAVRTTATDAIELSTADGAEVLFWENYATYED
ncbi:pirin family protein [Gordonia sp. ABSL1-1]|uniref:pirin family protein n=1 Tax=Gordonia sp. ABSL1-1 TaxID=3053923 RepID=UPI002573D0F0|nr:pirin family protein [Gordonia sp. ABSL1-1]MDL9938456.1 pirin family protein [Gordonia sp. ABSL1-1]